MYSKYIYILFFQLLFFLNAHAQIETNSVQKNFSQIKPLVAPFLLVSSGIVVNRSNIDKQIKDFRNTNFKTFHTSADDYLQYSPIIIAYGLDAIGIKSKTDILNRSVILLKSEIVANAFAQGVKRFYQTQRPDGSAMNSFPSGHTTQAFLGAAFLSEEYKHKYKWMPYAAYSLASVVGLLRITNNRHYLSDVLYGAGLGILSVKMSYLTHQYKWGKRKKISS